MVYHGGVETHRRDEGDFCPSSPIYLNVFNVVVFKDDQVLRSDILSTGRKDRKHRNTIVPAPLGIEPDTN